MISGVVDKLLNIDQWASPITPSWMVDFFSWLANLKNIEYDAIRNSSEYIIQVRKAAAKLNEVTDLCKKAGFDSYSDPAKVKEYMNSLPEYKQYKQMCGEEKEIVNKIRHQARLEFEQKFDNLDTFTKYVSERFEVYKEQHLEFGDHQLEAHKSELKELYHKLESPASEPL